MELATHQNSESQHWHSAFLAMLPLIMKIARCSFRRLPAEAREEAIQEVIANALVAFVRLVQQDKADVAHATPLASFAVAQVREGRKVGNRLNVRDVLSPYCRQRKGVIVERLDQWDAEEQCWQEVLVEDQTCTPADLAASRIDFAAWLASLSTRDRRIAKSLAAGEPTGHVAGRFGLSASRISQLRRQLQEAWHRFHEPSPLLADAAVAA